MPRKARDERLDTRRARAKLSPRREPYWRTIQEGRAIGYRRLAGGKAGTWIARHYEAGSERKYRALGTADDLLAADGAGTLSFSQAQDRARAWFSEIERAGGRVVEPVTVRRAMENYVADYQARGCKALRDLQRTISAHILPALGERLVSDLTFATLRSWHHKLASAPARLRTKANATTANVRKAETPDEKRARRATANRVLTVLKAALTLAYADGHAPSDDAWRRVKPFKKVDAPRIRYLTDPEAVRLVQACQPDLRKIVTAALLTGFRYGELASLRVVDFDTNAAMLHIRDPKATKPRAVPLSDDAIGFFTAEAAGKARNAAILCRAVGEPWGKSHQFRPLHEACAAAQISPAVSFHILRHTFATRLVRQGVPMPVIAHAIGDSVAICIKHYAHLAPDYAADTIRKYAGGMGIVAAETNVEPLETAAPRTV